MKISTRVFFNTVVLYFKVILSLAIALVTVPLVLKSLGASDYGLYNLVAGVVAMLSFLNSSMTVSSQRYMSVAMGENNYEKINLIYNASFILHFGLGLVLIIALEIIGIFAIDHLNIQPERMRCAKVIYQCLIVSTFAKIIAVPFDALVNAKEDMLPFSIIELIDSILMLTVAVLLSYISSDKLIFYGACVAFISVFTLFMKYRWCHYAYKDCKIKIRGYKGKSYIDEMLGFTGWNLFGGLATMGRNQGVAIIINIFLGTIVNAAYGVANQINGALGHFSATFQKAINPQLMKSEGMMNRNRLFRISYISSKFSVLGLAFFAIPLLMEMDEVLFLWLKNDIPPYTKRLAQCIILLSLVYQYSTGIMAAIQATGKIRNYQITMGVIILANVPIAYYFLKSGYPVYYTTMAFVIMEVISLCIRLYWSNRLLGMKTIDFFENVIFPTAVIICIPASFALIPHFLLEQSLGRFFLVCIVYCSLFSILMFRYAFDDNQRIQIISRIKHIIT